MADCIDCTHDDHDLCQQAGGGAWTSEGLPVPCQCWVWAHGNTRTVCVSHRRVAPCREEFYCRWSADPADIEAVTREVAS